MRFGLGHSLLTSYRSYQVLSVWGVVYVSGLINKLYCLNGPISQTSQPPVSAWVWAVLTTATIITTITGQEFCNPKMCAITKTRESVVGWLQDVQRVLG